MHHATVVEDSFGDAELRRISRGFRGVHQAWNEHKTVGCLITPGKDYGKVVEIATDHITCSECGKIVEPDMRGFAYCDCRIWNDGKPFAEKPLSKLAKQVRYDRIARSCRA